MPDNAVEFIIKITDKTKGALLKAGRAIKSFTRGALRSSRAIGRTFRTGFRMVARAARTMAVGAGLAFVALATTVKKAFDFERMEIQFEVLLGSADKAKQRMKELEELSARTPFQMPGIVMASKNLEILTGGAMGTAKSLVALGDAAAIMDAKIEEVALLFGRLYSAAKGGRPMGRVLRRFQQLGILSGEARNEIEKLSGKSKNFEQIIDLVNGALGRYSGGMERMAKTGHGLFSTLLDNWTLTLVRFGNEISKFSKTRIKELIDALFNLRKSGHLEKWGKATADWLDRVYVKLKPLIKSIGDLFSEDPNVREKALADLKEQLSSTAETFGAIAGAAILGMASTIGDAIGAAMRGWWKSESTTTGQKATVVGVGTLGIGALLLSIAANIVKGGKNIISIFGGLKTGISKFVTWLLGAKKVEALFAGKDIPARLLKGGKDYTPELFKRTGGALQKLWGWLSSGIATFAKSLISVGGAIFSLATLIYGVTMLWIRSGFKKIHEQRQVQWGQQQSLEAKYGSVENLRARKKLREEILSGTGYSAAQQNLIQGFKTGTNLEQIEGVIQLNARLKILKDATDKTNALLEKIDQDLGAQ